jgi:predicted nucleic acid-binding protein
VDIKLLPARATCMVDANIFVYHLGLRAGESTDFLDRVASKEVDAHVTTIVIAEVLHRQMLIEAVSKGLVTPSKALKKLKENPGIIQGLTDYITGIEKLLQLPLRVIEIKPADIARSHSIRRAHGLFVNDSINMAAAERVGIVDVVTHDADFKRLPKINVWEPTDV